MYEVQNAFKFYFNCTYSQYVVKMRMLKALAAILFTNLTLKQIAHNNNFSSYTNMHKVFCSLNILLNNIPRILY
ncbi:helix-turn-helix domain-containing protein [uncultured Weeksella sp.]|uniref:helix-turn-helix domain-containing protein n=1 Tax=uncultured Weeksella sp. TaxID=1161389 RepID=UPI00338EDCBF